MSTSSPAAEQPGPDAPLLVFNSYSRKDQKWLELLQAHLAPLERESTIRLWVDKGKIEFGDRFNDEIATAIDTSRAAILLISPHFQNSSFILENELPRLLRRADAKEIKLYWLLVSDCHLAKKMAKTYHSANDSRQPLDAMSEARVNTVLANLAQDLENHSGQASTACQAAASGENSRSVRETAVEETVPSDPPAPASKSESHGPFSDPRLDTVKDVLTAMVPIKPGSVTCKTGWLSGKKLRVDHPYSICQFPVTQKWYEAVIGTNPSHFTGNPQRPVETVSWQDAQAFCEKLNEVAAGLTGGMRFALPSEAQWEYACRAGSTGKFGRLKSGREGTVDEMAWYAGNSGKQTHPVGQGKEPNAFGLYEMHGNVWEWCSDQDGEYRVIRGGGWDGSAGGCRAAYRYGYVPGARINHIGFRLVLITQNK